MTAEEARLGAIVLLAKQPGKTSFASLYDVKRALSTRKVGHTGTLDSFATGLLVVCAGRLTKAVPYITQKDKTYKAVIEFGCETDTLDWTGKAVRTAMLPRFGGIKKALKKYTGSIMQSPPQFSAIHVAGKRASDIARSGQKAEIPPRLVTVYQADLLETLFDASDAHNRADIPLGRHPPFANDEIDANIEQTGNIKAAEDAMRVRAVMVSFTVSKGTYIRALARDIGAECGSAASLAALRRTRVGEYRLEDAALYQTLMPFTIENALASDSAGQRIGERIKEIPTDEAYKEIAKKAFLPPIPVI